MTDKQTTKVVQDGVELSWDRTQDGATTPEDAAKFYVDFTKALQQFKDRDPRGQPELRSKDKAEKELYKSLWTIFYTAIITAAVVWMFSQCNGGGHTLGTGY